MNRRRLTYIIAHEEIIGMRSISTNPKELDEIVKLAVNIAANRDGTLHRLNIPLLHQNRPSLIAQRLHLRFWQSLALHQHLDLPVQIRLRRHRFPFPNLLSDPKRRSRIVVSVQIDPWSVTVKLSRRERRSGEQNEPFWRWDWFLLWSLNHSFRFVPGSVCRKFFLILCFSGKTEKLK